MFHISSTADRVILHSTMDPDLDRDKSNLDEYRRTLDPGHLEARGDRALSAFECRLLTMLEVLEVRQMIRGMGIDGADDVTDIKALKLATFVLCRGLISVDGKELDHPGPLGPDLATEIGLMLLEASQAPFPGGSTSPGGG